MKCSLCGHGCNDIFRVAPCNVDFCHALERAEKGVGIDLAHQRSVFGKQQIDAAVVKSDARRRLFTQRGDNGIERGSLSPSAELRIGTEIPLRDAAHGGDGLSADDQHAKILPRAFGNELLIQVRLCLHARGDDELL